MAPRGRDNRGSRGAAEGRRDLLVTIGFALLAGLLSRLALLDGGAAADGRHAEILLRNLSLFLLPPIAGLLAWQRRRKPRGFLILTALAGILALYLNILPWPPGSQTATLTAIHLPLGLWLLLLPLYAGGDWRSWGRGMDFVRFSGEAFIYGVLMLCGTAVLGAFVGLIFGTAGMDAGGFLGTWLLPILAFATPVAAARVALAKRTVVESVAPVLARVFAPLFLLALLAFVTITLGAGRDPFADRNALIVFDLVLAVVAALVLWSSAMRDPRSLPGAADWVDLGLALTALVLDALLLAATIGRIGSWGASPNRLAALGGNLVLMVDLGGVAFFMGRHILRRGAYEAVPRWQVATLRLVLAWTAVVALAFPVAFGRG